MKNTKYIKISYKNKIYKINLEKITYILERLENHYPDNLNEKILIDLLVKYDLYDEYFLSNISKI